MNKALNINALIMLIVSISFAYFTAYLVAIGEGAPAYGWGFSLGRAVSGVLFPLGLVCLIRFIFRRKPMFTKGAFISWWVVFVLFGIMALIGSMLPPEA